MGNSFEPLLERCLPDYGCALAPAIIARLARFLEMIVAAQPRVRLVGSLDPEVLVRRHVGESLALLQARPLSQQHLVDVGSGAGFPGLALAIATPELKTTVVESNRKKASFLESVVSAIQLSDRVKVLPIFLERRPSRQGRAPLAGIQLVTVRALEHMQDVPSWLGRWLDLGAEAAFWVSDEMTAAWRTRYAGWEWGQFFPLPRATHRGIILARAVARETSVTPAR